jgi:hypothetical protein
MKKRIVIVNAGLMIAVLFSILIQSWHSYTHLAKQISEKECLHEYKSSKEITHQHEAFENCFVCAFALSSFIGSETISFEFKRTAIDLAIPFSTSRIFPSFFKGALFSLRGPPVV